MSPRRKILSIPALTEEKKLAAVFVFLFVTARHCSCTVMGLEDGISKRGKEEEPTQVVKGISESVFLTLFFQALHLNHVGTKQAFIPRIKDCFVIEMHI